MKSNKIKINPKLRWAPVVQNTVDPYRLDPSMPTPDELAQALKEKNFDDTFNISDHNVSAAFAELYTNVSSNRKSIVKEVSRLSGYYLVDALVSQLVDDALAPEISTGEIVNVTSEEPAVAKELEEFSKRINFDQLIQDITPDLVKMGEYTLKTDFGENMKGDVNSNSGSGIKHLRDVVEQGEVVALTQDGKIKGYLEMSEQKNKLQVYPPKHFVKFILSGARVKVNLRKNVPEKFLKDKKVKKLLKMLPRFVRVGKSLIYPILPKLKELELLEKLIPATKLAKLSSGSLVGMQMPESFDLSDAIKATKRMEGLVNNKLAIDERVDEITVQAIMSSAGRLKVLPVFGDKGTLQKFDYKSDEPDDLLNTVEQLRMVILDSVGIPYELIFKADSPQKSETIRRYAKYLRKLKAVQRSLTDGIKQIVHIHLTNAGVEFDPTKINVEFRNKLVEVDNLDRLEHMDVTVSLLGNLKTFVDELASGESRLKDSIKLEAYRTYLKTQLETIGLGDMIDEDAEIGELPEPDDDLGI